jgi:hypothetical protein
MRLFPIARALAELPEPTRPMQHLPACHAQACQSGDKPCPTPEACLLADADATFQRRSTIALAVMLAVALAGTIALASARALPGDQVAAEAAVVCSTGASR